MATHPPIFRKTREGVRLEIRSAAVEEAAEMLDFVREAHATTDQVATQPDELPPTPEAEADFLRGIRDNPASLLLIGLVEGKIVGGCGFFVGNRRRIAHTGTLGISIATEWRGRGVGRLLMLAMIDWARAHPTIEKVCLSVFSSNDVGQGLYRSLGFVDEGVRPGQAKLSGDRYVDEVFMGLWVKPRADAK
ncbi:MAG: GNAT family N-acetyltransferase [Phycisphaerales bacterium]|nr:GNAT family N-acetyltransferase [Phycisphaerales bacterium]